MAQREQEAAIKFAGKVDPSLQRSAQKAQGIIGSIVKADLIASAVKSGASALTSFVGDAVDSYKGFEQSMANASAIAGASAADYQKMQKAAMDAGAATSFTAAQAADALGYMSLAGWDTAKSITALQPMLKLAEATGADLAATSDAVTDSMSAIGVSADKVNEYMDVLIKTNNKANTSAAALMQAFVGCGASAQAAGMDYKTTAAALGVLANNGVKGAEAGTAMKAILTRMTSDKNALKAYRDLGVRIFDATGKTRDFGAIMSETNAALGKLTEKQRAAAMATLAGADHIGKYQFLLKGAGKAADGTAGDFEKLRNEVNNADGALEAMYAETSKTLNGAMNRLNSAIDSVRLSFMLKVGPKLAAGIDYLASNVLPKIAKAAETAGAAFSGFIDTVSRLYDAFNSPLMSSEELWLRNTLASVWRENKDAIELAAIAVGGFTAAVVAAKAPLIAHALAEAFAYTQVALYVWITDAAAVATKAFGAAMAWVASPIGIAVLAIAGILAAGALLYNHWEELKAAGLAFAQKMADAFPWAAGTIEATVHVIGGVCTGLKDIFAGIVDFVKGVFTGNWGQAWQGVVTVFAGIFEGIKSVALAPINFIYGALNDLIAGLNNIKIPDWVPGIGGKGINIPQIPMLASGGIATAPTLSVIGEGSEPEAVLPLSKLSAMLSGGAAPAVAGAGAGGAVTFAPVINISGSADESTVNRAMGAAFTEFKRMMAQYERENARRRF